MKKRLSAVICLLLLHPEIALTAQESTLEPASFPLFPFLSLLLSVVVGWLSSRLWRLDREKKEVLARLQLVQQVLDQVPVDIMWTDCRLTIIQANQAALQSAGEQRLIGCDLRELRPDLVNHPFVAALQSCLQGTVSMQPPGCVPIDDEIPGKQILALMTDNSQGAIWFGKLLHDSDEEAQGGDEQHKEETDGLAQAVESASRMKSEFIANINHEIRTPMNAIIGYAEMLINADLGPRETRFVNILHKSSLTLVSIFNDIMELSKIDSGRLQIMFSPVRLQSIVNEVEEMFKDLAHEKDLRLRCRIAPHLPKVLILDGLRLKQVLQNLVSNAIKFTASGSVELMVDGQLSQENESCFDLSFRVEDSGIGVPMADQEKIFELFQQREDTISKQYGGVGLGLTLCSRLVAMMGGWIELFSNEGEGARFTVFLNAIKVVEQDSGDLSADVNSAVIDREQKLLIVDDMDLIKEVFVDYFQNSSFTVLTANTGEEALVLAVREKPGIIFMDLNLAGMDGRTVTEQLRNQAETAKIPVVVMTGDILDETDYRPLFDDFLQKPFRFEELKAIIARYIPCGRADALQLRGADTAVGEDQIFFDNIVAVWTAELEKLCSQAVRSGSLADAVSLGAAMLKAGEKAPQSLLTELGGELVQYAAEPNILGVDRLLAKLTRIANRN